MFDRAVMYIIGAVLGFVVGTTITYNLMNTPLEAVEAPDPVCEVQPEIYIAIGAAKSLAWLYSSEVPVTYTCDGEHSEGSLHYSGNAVDLRRWNLPDPTTYVSYLRTVLGEDYDVILEETHIHVEYDPQ